jgi:predicted small metal-binding protein
VKFTFTAEIKSNKFAMLAVCDRCNFVASAKRYESLIESFKEHHEYAHPKVRTE